MRSLVYLLLLLFIPVSLAQPSVKVVTELSPPNQTRINDSVTGYSTDIVKLILNKASINAAIEIYPWARAYKMARTHPNTLIYSLARTVNREPLFHWIGPVAKFKLGFVKLTKRHDIVINNLSQARQYNVAVQRNDLAYNVLTKYGFSVVLTSDIQKSYHLLLAKKVDLIIDDENYLSVMSEQLAIDTDKISFVYAIDELAVAGYLAANINMDSAMVNKLKSAFEEVKITAQYHALLSSK
ncbi:MULTISPECIES: transporter substrate-binding domain-containing protein [unclassified Pseudoalteromonas]|uniref:substrate-binding periplasmic protein n=1 Tax=unclassified Pseudoalteromonas TaxID=194690 RepID=UPI000B3C2411|nr:MULTISPECIES: transporter substrate-binding domain-containing protein [unclassified Pseudoalteromonas]MDN3380969.1 transporter substrate-binding domain-containing protein [Pseudoalteromonas sp. APC 3893]MDN3388870.1 transporter substrate-binding domain-containing protein [Pseudoalteromonas sp. APC 4017]OUS69983.1 amino acid ABC transporter substrate-binding protein [Pseudoalteromonas sp. A601]